MAIILDLYTVPKKGKVELKVNRSFEIKVTSEEARHQVNRWLLNEVSYMMATDLPTLVVGERVAWRVPAWFGAPHLGRIGVVGAIDVDVETGELSNLAECKAEIEQNLDRLKPQISPYQLRSIDEGQAYQAKNIPPAPSLILPNEEPKFVTQKTN